MTEVQTGMSQLTLTDTITRNTKAFIETDPTIVAKGRRDLFAVFDALDGQCMLEDFSKEYHRQFRANFHKARKKYFNPLSEIGQFLGKEVIVSEKPKKLTLVNKSYEGRRRMLAALREIGDMGTEKELDDSYLKLYGSPLSSDLKKYFGVYGLESAVAQTNKVLILHKSDAVYILLKPDFSGMQGIFENYRATLTKDISGDEDLFNHQCAFLLLNVKAAIRRCEQKPTIEYVCKYFTSLGGSRAKFAVLLKSTQPKLLKFMLPDKAWVIPLRPNAPKPAVAPVTQTYAVPPKAGGGGSSANPKFQPKRAVKASKVPSNAYISKIPPQTRKDFFNRMINIVRACGDDVLLTQFVISYKDKFDSDFANDWPKFDPSAKSTLELSNRITAPLSLTKYNSTWRFQYSEVRPVPEGKGQGVQRIAMQNEQVKKQEIRDRRMGEYWDLESEMYDSLDGTRSHRSNFSGLLKR